MPDGRLGHCKLCELSDFADPELAELIRDVYASDLEYFGDADSAVGDRKKLRSSPGLPQCGDLSIAVAVLIGFPTHPSKKLLK